MKGANPDIETHYKPRNQGLSNMKMVISLAALAVLSTSAMAETGCNPAVGNWVNAAPTTCAVSDKGGDKFGAGGEIPVPHCAHWQGEKPKAKS